MVSTLKRVRRNALAAITFATSPRLAFAATTTVTMIQPLGSDVPGIVASIVSVAPAATAYAMACGTNFPPVVSNYPREVLVRKPRGKTMCYVLLFPLTIFNEPYILSYHSGGSCISLVNEKEENRLYIR